MSQGAGRIGNVKLRNTVWRGEQMGLRGPMRPMWLKLSAREHAYKPPGSWILAPGSFPWTSWTPRPPWTPP